MSETCDTCKYWSKGGIATLEECLPKEEQINLDTEPNQGRCQRYPSIAVPWEGTYYWTNPAMLGYETCGEWKPLQLKIQKENRFENIGE